MMTRKDYFVLADIVKSFTLYDRAKVGIKIVDGLSKAYENFDAHKFYKNCGLSHLVCTHCGSKDNFRIDDNTNAIFCESCGYICNGKYETDWEADNGL